MKKIFASRDVAIVSFYKSILEDNNIATLVKNYYLTSGVGDLPPNDCIPELWIMDDNKLEEAKKLLIVEIDSPWQCACGEEISGQFSQCWKCGKIRE